MRAELSNVQGAVDKQAVLAAKQIAEAEKQRDAAIQEAVYAKAKLAAHMGGSVASTPQLDNDRDVDERSGEIGRKLASALHLQKQLQARIESMGMELDASGGRESWPTTRPAPRRDGWRSWKATSRRTRPRPSGSGPSCTSRSARPGNTPSRPRERRRRWSC